MKRKKDQCRVCRFFKDVSKSHPVWQRIYFELIAKAAREHPEAHGYDLLDFMEAERTKVDEFLRGGVELWSAVILWLRYRTPSVSWTPVVGPA